MFSFLNSGILAFAAAAIIPFLIYLFAKRKPQKMIFSSIRFIKESQRKQKTKINLKNLLLLLIRICIILFTIFAIARPTIKSKFVAGTAKHPKTAIAVIIDNSYSMDYLVDSQTEFDKAKNICREINEIVSQEDITLLLTLDEAWNQLHGQLTFGKMDNNKIRQIEITPTALSLQEVIQTAEEKLQESHILNQEIYVLTDFQNQKIPEDFSIPTFFIPTSEGKERANLSCEYAELQSDFVSRSYQKNIMFQIKNHSQFRQEDVVCHLFLNGRTIAEKVIELQPKQKITDSFSLVLERSGWHSGYVEVRNERLAYDNRYYFSFYYNHTPSVAIISDENKLPFSLAGIVDIYTPESVEFIVPDKIESETFRSFDNVIIYKKRNISSRLQFLLEQFTREGKGYLFIADKNLSDEAKSFVGEQFSLQWQEFYQKSQLRNIDFSNPYHSVTKLLSSEIAGITDFWQTNSQATVLLRTLTHPLAVEENNSILWLFDAASFQNEFLLDAAFPIFAYQSLRFLAENFQAGEYQIGDRIPLQDNQIILPDGSLLTSQKNYHIAKQTGLYSIGSDEKKIAVNLDYTESIYERLPEKEIKNLIFSSADWQDEILQARYGYEIWKFLLIFVLLLFIAEMLLVKSEERKK
jgi:hypothetical protein